MENIIPANLIPELDKKVMVWLRDGRTLIGILRSVDQFANLVLHQTIERIYIDDKYGDIPRGIFVIRGENVALLGDVINTKEPPTALRKVSINDILKSQEAAQNAKMNKEQALCRVFKSRGLIYNIADNSLELL